MRLPRKNCTSIKKILLIVGGLTILLVAFVCFSYRDKKIHLSVDDVSACMMHLTKDSLNCVSIFEEPLFAQLQELHDKYGAKFTLYTYKKNDWYDINIFPRKYRQDFQANKDWLTIRFHAETPSLSKNVIADYKRFKKAYSLTTSNLRQKCIGGGKTLRLEYFFLTRQECDFLKSQGVLVLLSADDDRISYSLPKDENEDLTLKETLVYKGLTYERTDIRIEKENPICSVIANLTDDKIILFTHEWALSESKWNRVKFKALIWFYALCGCEFILD